MRVWHLVSGISLFLLASSVLRNLALANDSAASVALGGIQLKRESRISMEKEKLTISEKKITVEYEFLNDTDQDITTEVAFPIPPYEGYYIDESPEILGVDSFRLWVEGEQVKYAVEAKATKLGTNYTRTLEILGIDIPSFARIDPDDPNFEKSQLTALPLAKQQQLIDIGLMDRETKLPRWTVMKTYHWQQKFPAHALLHVKHEYRPVEGYQQTSLKGLEPETVKQEITQTQEQLRKNPQDAFASSGLTFLRPLENSCIDSATRKKLAAGGHAAVRGDEKVEDKLILASWIDYILTTANSWKTPIKDFELIVERPAHQNGAPPYVSFCWDGPVERVDENHFSAKLTNFVPRRELTVIFLKNMGF